MSIEALFDPTKLNPNELTGILVKETVLCGIINNKPVRRRVVPFENLDLFADNDRKIRVFIKDNNLDIIDLTGASAVFTVKEKKSSPSATFTKSTTVPAEGTIGAADEGEIFFFILPADTVSLDIRQYVYDVKVTLSDSTVFTVLEGILNLLQPVG